MLFEISDHANFFDIFKSVFSQLFTQCVVADEFQNNVGDFIGRAAADEETIDAVLNKFPDGAHFVTYANHRQTCTHLPR